MDRDVRVEGWKMRTLNFTFMKRIFVMFIPHQQITCIIMYVVQKYRRLLFAKQVSSKLLVESGMTISDTKTITRHDK